jgi:hypothetical protein
MICPFVETVVFMNVRNHLTFGLVKIPDWLASPCGAPPLVGSNEWREARTERRLRQRPRDATCGGFAAARPSLRHRQGHYGGYRGAGGASPPPLRHGEARRRPRGDYEGTRRQKKEGVVSHPFGERASASRVVTGCRCTPGSSGPRRRRRRHCHRHRCSRRRGRIRSRRWSGRRCRR